MLSVDTGLIVLAITIMADLLLAALVYKNNPKSATNIIFGGLAFVTALWLVDVYISVKPSTPDLNLLWVRLSVTFAVPQITLFFLLAHTLPAAKTRLSRKRWTILITANLFLIADAMSRFAFPKVSVVHGKVESSAGPGLPLFVAFALFTSYMAMLVLYRKLKRAGGYAREQYRYVFMGSVLMLGLLLVTVLLPVAIFNNSFFVQFAPLYTIIFLGATTYAIVAQKLFDLRTAVVRSVAYAMLVTFIASLYGFLLFGVLDKLFNQDSQRVIRQIISVILVVLIALSFQSIKKFFDRVTNRIFYQNSYDAQDVLDSLGSVLVSEIDLYRILREVRRILSQALKSSSIEFILFKGDRPYFEAHAHKTIDRDSLALTEHIVQQKHDLLVTDDMNAEDPLRQSLAKANVALSLRLKTREQVVGYVIFGPKRSGDIYSAKDKRLLTILANELAITIQNALRFEEIQNFNLTLRAKVDEATKKLRRANEKLKALDETKDDFISMASHQLRTPLTSVKGYVSMILEGEAGKLNHTQHEMLGQALMSSQRMVYLIADLLNVSRLRTGKFVVELTTVNLGQVISEEIEQLTEMAKVRSQELTYEVPKKFPDLMLDDVKTRQVIMNFVDNALHYTPQGGKIKVRLAETPTTVEMRVEDNGIGVPASDQHHLFTKFYRAPNARKARPDGTGLGLFMAKKIIVAQGGSIIFESKEGKGSTFGFVFSKAEHAVKNPKPTPIPAAHQQPKEKTPAAVAHTHAK